MKRRKIKEEAPETSRSSHKGHMERDLAYYIHDRVELMHQVFSLLKTKELKAMAPASVGDLSIDDLEELCLEELLGISSKRLCAVLDGADPPSDTESSSESEKDQLETISLDSISSDEGVLSPVPVAQKSKKQNKRHCKRKEAKHKGKGSPGGEGRAAERAGMTVLELLELQARARAIRAQLAAEHKRRGADKEASAPAAAAAEDDDDVLIKEERPEVVELSSDDEKPDVAALGGGRASTTTQNESQSTKTVTKKHNDLTIIVPQPKTRRIKLNRNKASASVANVKEKAADASPVTQSEPVKEIVNTNGGKSINTKVPVAVEPKPATKEIDKAKKKTKEVKDKRKKKEKKKDGDNSDHDEIMLQLSDSEKMDLLEDFDRKNYDKVSSSSSDSDDSSSDSDHDNSDIDDHSDKHGTDKISLEVNKPILIEEDNSPKEDVVVINDTSASDVPNENDAVIITSNENTEPIEQVDDSNENDTALSKQDSDNQEQVEKVLEISRIEDVPILEDKIEETPTNEMKGVDKETVISSPSIENSNNVEVMKEQNNTIETEPVENDNTATETNIESTPTVPELKKTVDEKSEGELSEKSSSEVEAFEVRPEVVCISDDDKGKLHKKKKLKKKDKKSKKEKKSKKQKKSDFREGSDQNFFKETPDTNVVDSVSSIGIDSSQSSLINIDSDNVYEILELSDDSSCYEVEGVSVLSKEPTSEEIEALSAKIEHEIERKEVVTEEEIKEHERTQNDVEVETESVENVSWKDRYLGSKKVKRVLSTSNILNALRKKNKELKRKLDESKKVVIEVEVEQKCIIEEKEIVEEGTIEHYNTLQGSVKYVDAVVEKSGESEQASTNNAEVLDKEMKKDAKQLFKMYKRLLKYNNMEKIRDPNKPKKKKNKKQKKGKDGIINVANNENVSI